MPLRVYCNDCGHLLYEGNELKSPDDIISEHVKNEKCPNCGRVLSYLPIDVKVTPKGKEYKPPLQTLKKEFIKKGPVTPLEHDFLSIFDKRTNEILQKFNLYPVSQKIFYVGGWSTKPKNEVKSLSFSVDQDEYANTARIVRRDIKRQVSEYLERKLRINWMVVNPSNVPLEKRIEYEERLLKKLEKLTEILQS